jgi:hypothetical protein
MDSYVHCLHSLAYPEVYVPLVQSFHEVVRMCGDDYVDVLATQFCVLLSCENDAVLAHILPRHNIILNSFEMKEYEEMKEQT